LDYSKRFLSGPLANFSFFLLALAGRGLGVFARRTEERVRNARISLDRTAGNWFYHWTFWIFSFLFGIRGFDFLLQERAASA
jgi:hypothetical protein